MTYSQRNETSSNMEDSKVLILDKNNSENVTYLGNEENTYDSKTTRYSNVYEINIADQFKDMQVSVMQEHIPVLTKLLDESSFDSGYESLAEKYYNDLYKKYGLIADSLLLNIYHENMYEKPYLLKHLLFIVANLSEDRRNNLVFIPLAGIGDPDIEIQDLSVRCFELWEDKKYLPTLKEAHKKVQITWFKDYLADVIEALEEG